MTTASASPTLSLPVAVTVSDGVITCTPDSLPVEAKDTQIVWVLGTSGYHFPKQNAIVIKVPGTAFPDASDTLQSQLATILDSCPHEQTYSYTITVVDNTTGQKIILDPEIKNQGVSS